MRAAVIRPPSQQLIHACDRLDEATGRAIKDAHSPFFDLGRYESDVEVRVLFSVMVRHIEALVECATKDIVLLPAGRSITRVVLEQSIKVQWLLYPASIWDREARYLAHLADEERMWERCARATDSQEDRLRGESIRQIRLSIEEKLPRDVTRLQRVPTFESILVELREQQRYSTYTVLSQYVHGSHHSGSTFKRGFGSEREFGERATVEDWGELLKVAWWSLAEATRTIVRVCGGRGLVYLDKSMIERVESALSGIATSAPS